MKNKKTRNTVFILIMITILSFAPAIFAGDGSGIYWVSPTGTTTWSNCESATPLSGTSCCSLSTANTNASAGDTINLRGGTYNTPIDPSNSGTSGNLITYQAYTGETPTLTDVGEFQSGIDLNGSDYLKIDGITVHTVYKLVVITGGSDHNEITNCTIYNGSNVGNSGFHIKGASTHNWVHNNTIYQAGYISASCGDSSNLMKIGNYGEDYSSHYNTIEDNTLYWGGHHVLEIYTQYNVIRNNVFHNEGWMDNPGDPPCSACADDNNKFGNRNMMIYNNQTPHDTHILIEGNRFGHAGLASDGNGADNLTIGGNKNIARYNSMFNAMEVGLYFRTSGVDSEYNRVYNNTIYKNGQGPACRYGNYPGFTRRGIRLQSGADNNVIKNNIVYDNTTSDIVDSGANNSISNNSVGLYPYYSDMNNISDNMDK